MSEDATRPNVAYKISPAPEWAAACAVGVFTGSADDVRDGFIHLSTKSQLAGTLDRHYKGRGDLVIAAVDVSSLGPSLRWEPSRGGDMFPHLYGPLPMAAVLWTCDIVHDRDGRLVLPANLR